MSNDPLVSASKSARSSGKREDDWGLKIPDIQIDTAEYFVLAKCTDPAELVELIGWAPQWHLDGYGTKSINDDVVRLEPECLYPFEPLFIPPDRIRESQKVTQSWKPTQ